MRYVIGCLRLVVHSVAAVGAEGKRWLGVIAHPRTRWTLWQWGPGASKWVFFAEPAVLAWIVADTIQATVSGDDLGVLGLFLACGLAHAYWTRESEERRRGAHGNATHVDQTSVWFFSAAVVLPVPLVLALIVVIRVQRWLIARKPMHKWLHTNFAIALSALGVHAVAVHTPLQDWVTGRRALPDTALEAVAPAACMLAAVAAYFLAQAVMVGAVRALAHLYPPPGNEPDPDESLIVDALGTWRDNGEILLVLLVAVAATLAHAFSAPMLVLMVPVVVYTTRVAQDLAQAKAHIGSLEIDVTHDPMTGLLNRRGFEDSAHAALARDRRDRRPTSLLLLDLDKFKLVNDTWGHVVGDQVLVAFAGAVRSVITRGSDLVVRWGGEEVAVLLPDTGASDARLVAERIRVAVATMKVPITKAAGGDTMLLGGGDPDDPPGFTVSIGVATTGSDHLDLTNLAEAADGALYEAKRSGRNRVCVSGYPREVEPDSVAV